MIISCRDHLELVVRRDLMVPLVYRESLEMLVYLELMVNQAKLLV